MSDTTTRGVRIRVTSVYVPERSLPFNKYYFFAYHVNVANHGSETVQLVSREWIITDADGKVETVRGEGVVGEQPILEPGDSFEYTSFCPLETSVGSMEGTYQMKTSSGEHFDAIIRPFSLAVPTAVN